MRTTIRSIFLITPVLFVLTSCKKAEVAPVVTTIAPNQGFITVSCDNCKVDYGMPDQYKAFNIANGTSPKAPYTFSAGYTLQVNITAYDHTQKITLNVYGTKGESIYSNNTTQSTTGYWGNATILPLE